MPSVTRTFTTTATPEAAYRYLADFTNAEEWDPGTQTCERTSGDGGVGTTYRNVSTFLGREVEITYTAAELAPPTRVHLRGTNEQFEGHDIFVIRAAGRGSEVTYRADMSFSGLWRSWPHRWSRPTCPCSRRRRSPSCAPAWTASRADRPASAPAYWRATRAGRTTSRPARTTTDATAAPAAAVRS